MDGRRVDDLVRRLARSTGSRRGLLAMVAEPARDAARYGGRCLA